MGVKAVRKYVGETEPRLTMSRANKMKATTKVFALQFVGKKVVIIP